MTEESAGKQDATEQLQTESVVPPENTSEILPVVKDKKQLEIQMLMRQQEQLKSLEELGKLQQQKKARTENTQDEPHPVGNETPEMSKEALQVRNEMPQARNELPGVRDGNVDRPEHHPAHGT